MRRCRRPRVVQLRWTRPPLTDVGVAVVFIDGWPDPSGTPTSVLPLRALPRSTRYDCQGA
jgi:hypothetical protein